MRELKFRAYSKSRNRYLGKGDTLIYRHEVGLDGSRWWASLVERQDHSDEDIIVEQYTGLKDKNGKEIYEGDLVRMYGVIFATKWRDQDFSYIFSRPEIFYWLNIGKSSDCEVIGNIHENPELLEEEK